MDYELGQRIDTLIKILANIDARLEMLMKEGEIIKVDEEIKRLEE